MDPEPDFDEQRVLEELEALHAAIGAARGEPGTVVPASTAAVTDQGARIDRDPGPLPVARLRSRAFLIAGAGAAAAMVLAVVLLRPQGSPDAGQSRVEPPPAVPVPTAAPAPQPSIDAHPVRADLTLSRRVWIRVTVDGAVLLEKEAVAGEQLHFGGDRSIVVRAGDAGGVSVRVNEADQGPMGRDGQVLTRLFEAPVRQ